MLARRDAADIGLVDLDLAGETVAPSPAYQAAANQVASGRCVSAKIVPAVTEASARQPAQRTFRPLLIRQKRRSPQIEQAKPSCQRNRTVVETGRLVREPGVELAQRPRVITTSNRNVHPAEDRSRT